MCCVHLGELFCVLGCDTARARLGVRLHDVLTNSIWVCPGEVFLVKWGLPRRQLVMVMMDYTTKEVILDGV